MINLITGVTFNPQNWCSRNQLQNYELPIQYLIILIAKSYRISITRTSLVPNFVAFFHILYTFYEVNKKYKSSLQTIKH